MKRKRERPTRSNIGLLFIILLALVVIAIGGWPLFFNHQNLKSSSEQSDYHGLQSTSEISSSSNSPSTKEFSTSKIAKMDNYMADFSTYMGQDYKRYYPQTQNQAKLNFYEFDITTDLDAFNYYVDNEPATFRLGLNRNDSSNNNDYNIVSVYSDAATAPFAGAHLYLLTIHNNKPQVLITMQNQACPITSCILNILKIPILQVVLQKYTMTNKTIKLIVFFILKKC